MYALTIFLSAFLLFQVQPLLGKNILPWFGGTPAVWTTCMLFFQTILLGGYAYAHLFVSRLSPKQQGILHMAFLVLSLVALPLNPSPDWKPEGAELPVWRILALLAATVGMPYFMLSATGPLLQGWSRRVNPGSSPYRLYALSNVGSLLALLGYPFFFEWFFPLAAQRWMWSIGYGAFALCCLYCAFRVNLLPDNEETDSPSPENSGEASGSGVAGAAAPSWSRIVLWLALSTTGSVLLLSTTNQMSQEVAVIPFLWVLPLALYLLSFILCFDSEAWYSRYGYGIMLALASGLACRVLEGGMGLPLIWQVIGYTMALFAGVMICHGELVRLKPHPRYLTLFYLMVSIGGALGGLLVAVISPLIFSGFWEYHLSLVACWALGFGCMFADRTWSADKRFPLWAGGLVLALSGTLMLSNLFLYTAILWGGCALWFAGAARSTRWQMGRGAAVCVYLLALTTLIPFLTKVPSQPDADGEAWQANPFLQDPAFEPYIKLLISLAVLGLGAVIANSRVWFEAAERQRLGVDLLPLPQAWLKSLGKPCPIFGRVGTLAFGLLAAAAIGPYVGGAAWGDLVAKDEWIAMVGKPEDPDKKTAKEAVDNGNDADEKAEPKAKRLTPLPFLERLAKSIRSDENYGLSYFTTVWGALLSVAGFGLLALIAAFHDLPSLQHRGRPLWRWPALATTMLFLACALWLDFRADNSKAIVKTRNFYGVLRVSESTMGEDDLPSITLTHGHTTHGEQFAKPSERNQPTTYYSRSTGIGMALDNHPARLNELPLSYGVIGLGVGTLASYAEAADNVRFYEINRGVLELSDPGLEWADNIDPAAKPKFGPDEEPERYFWYLFDCRAARKAVILGDARVQMERELAERERLESQANEGGADAQAALDEFDAHRPRLDVLAVDAFSSDSIPMHLLTLECVELYWKILKEDGILALHISNRQLELAPLCRGLAKKSKRRIISMNGGYNSLGGSTSEWVLLTDNEAFLNDPVIVRAVDAWDDAEKDVLYELDYGVAAADGEGEENDKPGGPDGEKKQRKPFPIWTDDYGSVLEVLTEWEFADLITFRH